MKTTNRWLNPIRKLGWLLMMGVSMTANAGLFGFGAVNWKEEVQLHDGRKIIVERSQSYGGRHEIGQSQPVKEQEISFTVPGANKAIIFKSEFSEDVGRANFNFLALHIINSTPYLVVEPNLCLSYNKWGRPNPPYLFFKHDSKAWQRIPLSELPVEFKSMNIVINNGREEHIKKAESDLGYVPAESIKKINSSLKQLEYKTILREALPNSQLCPPELTGFKAPYPTHAKGAEVSGK